MLSGVGKREKYLFSMTVSNMKFGITALNFV